MLRITVIESGPSAKTLRLEGRIAGALVPELRRLCRELLASIDQPQVILDMSDVSFIDADGVALMRELGRFNFTVTNYSPFIAQLLREVV